MQEKEKKLKELVMLVFFLAAVFAVIWILTAITPLVGDDYNYAFSWTDHSRIDNFTLVRQSMRTHRNWTHGRVFAQGWVSLFMMWPRWLFSFANACTVTAFFASLYHYFKRENTTKPIAACAAVAVLYWICMPAFGQVFLWLDGACNYFWGVALAWILLEMEFSLNSARESNHVAFLTLLSVPLAFVAGAWSEHISFAYLIIQFLDMIKQWMRDRTLYVAKILIFLSGCAGYLFLMLAPSMLPSILRRRALQAAGGHLQAIMGFFSGKGWLVPVLLLCGILFWLVMKKKPDRNARWTTAFMVAFIFCVFLDIFYFIRIVIARKSWSAFLFALISSTQVGFLTLMSCYCYCMAKAFRERINCDTIMEAIILGAGGVSALVLFALAMYVPARGFCAPVSFIGIAVVRLCFALPKKKNQAGSISFLLIFLLCLIVGVCDIVNVSKAAAERDKAIAAALASDGILITSPYPEKTKYSAQYGIQDLTEDGSWPNDIMIEYYGLNDIQIELADDEEKLYLK